MRTDRFVDIADYIMQRRAEAGLSQEGLATALINYDPLFAELDPLTISRWERAKVSPNLRRQVALMEFFNDQPHQLLCDPDFNLKQLPSLDAFNKFVDQQLNYNHVMGAHPYIPTDDIRFDRLCKKADEAPKMYELIANYHTNLSRGRENWTAEFLAELAKVSSTQVAFYMVGGLLAGHIIMLKISDHTLEQLLKGTLRDDQIKPANLLSQEQTGSLYLLSTYLGGRHVSDDFIAQLLLTLAEDPKNSRLGLKARSDIGLKLMELLGGEVVQVGNELTERLDGAKYQGKRHSFVSFQLERQALLASPLFLNLIRNNQ
ncbi:helix-turn-helix transcriptional regulator [Shewanella schlegeliana]|uniref:Helix-turn-helix transcriptional regulator n=1 Tax=Shewanella schlegeliana TaxID=190308 RepID=A0ABS1SX06_9GAMM|nr:helix-turn-helix transcriptional regulator [Shewanella schlegeliana]MBL4912880.1 helix-turn-helix transcriptional regulator [Shewanella schlegeliana]MCL1109023.1 helix-turn-helix transcriptional regulator [Shewanella schlegeliana]GIU23309.1 hypothetical protein TUM4433_05510 [Shewanella schlegeliana]